MMSRRFVLGIGIVYAAVMFFIVGRAFAQELLSAEDEFSIPFGLALEVEAFGVLENDTLDGENAGESGATAELLEDASHGTLAFFADGSFTYSPGASFDGSDHFVYRALSGQTVSAPATVQLTACSEDAQIVTCWNETAFRAKAAAFGLTQIEEGFENEAVWGVVRSPNTATGVTSQGIEWRANDFDPTHTEPPSPPPPAPNSITTGPGPAHRGAWGAWDAMHGYAWGSATICDIDDPPAHCLHHDGMTIRPVAGQGPLRGMGGYFRGIHGANVAFVLDGDYTNPIGGGKMSVGPHRFFGVLSADPVGFSELQFREIDGKNGQALYIWADDFTILLGSGAPPVPSLSPLGWLGLGLGLTLLARRGETGHAVEVR